MKTPRQRVTGIGGIFLKARDPEKLQAWYKEHLGIPVDEHGYVSFYWSDDARPEVGMTVWNLFQEDSDYFAPSTARQMVNYRVDDLEALVAQLEAEGIKQVGEMEVHVYGRFAWILDPEGNKIELWQPPDDVK